METRPDAVWVPGYWALNGYYIEGYWRPARRAGHVWVEGGYSSDRRWHYGHWERRR